MEEKPKPVQIAIKADDSVLGPMAVAGGRGCSGGSA